MDVSRVVMDGAGQNWTTNTSAIMGDQNDVQVRSLDGGAKGRNVEAVHDVEEKMQCIVFDVSR